MNYYNNRCNPTARFLENSDILDIENFSESSGETFTFTRTDTDGMKSRSCPGPGPGTVADLIPISYHKLIRAELD